MSITLVDIKFGRIPKALGRAGRKQTEYVEIYLNQSVWLSTPA
jgi:hypothetical protein